MPLLAALATAGGETGKAAEDTLCRLNAEGVEEAIARYATSAEAGVAAALVRVMAARGDADSVPALLQLVGNGNDAVRHEALRALGALGDGAVIPRLCRLLRTTTNETDFPWIERAIISIGRRTRGTADPVPDLVAALTGSTGRTRALLVVLLGQFGGEAALTAARAALRDEDATVKGAAVRALANWPDLAPLDALLELSRSAETEALRLTALSGYIRMVGRTAGRSSDEMLALYRSALSNAGRGQEKKQILGELAEVLDYGVLGVIEARLQDEAVGAEARLAYLKSAKGVGPLSPGAAIVALRRVSEAVKAPEFAASAREIIEWIDEIDGHLTAWSVSGPYAVTTGDLMAATFAPEEVGAQGAEWRQVDATAGPFTRFITPGGVNLGALFSDTNAVAYLRTSVRSPEQRQAVIELGSDDGVKVWLNGKVVHTNDARRATHRASDKAPCELREGWNELLVKVTQATGEWGLCLRFTHPDGLPMHDLRVSPW